MKVNVEVFETSADETGRTVDAGWRTDSTSSRYWAGRRWQELVERGQTVRLTDTRGDVLALPR